jgi:hypothetical protein
MLDILAAIFIDGFAAISPTFKEDNRRGLAEARQQDQTGRARHYAIAAQIDAVLDSTMIETDLALQGLDPLYQVRLNHHRRRYGLRPVKA